MQIKKVGVIGCGLMGHGIAQVAAQGGCEVVVVETEQKFLDTGLARIDKSLAKLAEKAKEKGGSFDAAPVRARIKGSLDRKSVADCDLVVGTEDAPVVDRVRRLHRAVLVERNDASTGSRRDARHAEGDHGPSSHRSEMLVVTAELL